MNRVRKAVESQYKALCNVYEYKKVKDEYTKITSSKEVLSMEQMPCRLSFEKINSTSLEGVPIQNMTAKLFISPDIVIKSGSKIEVTQDNVTTVFAHSGKSAIYPSHQEIILELFDEYA